MFKLKENHNEERVLLPSADAKEEWTWQVVVWCEEIWPAPRPAINDVMHAADGRSRSTATLVSASNVSTELLDKPVFEVVAFHPKEAFLTSAYSSRLSSRCLIMVLEYFNVRKSKDGAQTAVPDAPKSPILNDEDERFLEQLTTEEQPPPLPERPVVILDNGDKAVGKDAQVALMDGAEKIPLPQSPPVQSDSQTTKTEESKAAKKAHEYLTYVRNIPQKFTHKVSAVFIVL
jgi:hypothetical protein